MAYNEKEICIKLQIVSIENLTDDLLENLIREEIEITMISGSEKIECIEIKNIEIIH